MEKNTVFVGPSIFRKYKNVKKYSVKLFDGDIWWWNYLMGEVVSTHISSAGYFRLVMFLKNDEKFAELCVY